MAIALDQCRGISHEKSTKLEFNVVEIASSIDWDSGKVKHHLKQLEWMKGECENILVILLNNISKAANSYCPKLTELTCTFFFKNVSCSFLKILFLF